MKENYVNSILRLYAKRIVKDCFDEEGTDKCYTLKAIQERAVEKYGKKISKTRMWILENYLEESIVKCTAEKISKTLNEVLDGNKYTSTYSTIQPYMIKNYSDVMEKYFKRFSREGQADALLALDREVRLICAKQLRATEEMTGTERPRVFLAVNDVIGAWRMRTEYNKNASQSRPLKKLLPGFEPNVVQKYSEGVVNPKEYIEANFSSERRFNRKFGVKRNVK